MNNSEKTTNQYWDKIYSFQPKSLMPLNLFAGSRNLLRLFKKHIKPGMEVLEIGCAPGNYLAYITKNLKANVSGVDYSIRGIALSHKLFDAFNIKGDLRCEDIFTTTFPFNSFDFVYSNGVIEHFDEPKDIIRRHIELLKPGGTALITVPNYRGIYGRLQRYFDYENLLIPNEVKLIL